MSCAGEAAMTFEELDRRSSCLANYLQELGVASDTPVAFMLKTGTDMVMVVMAILKVANPGLWEVLTIRQWGAQGQKC